MIPSLAQAHTSNAKYGLTIYCAKCRKFALLAPAGICEPSHHEMVGTRSHLWRLHRLARVWNHRLWWEAFCNDTPVGIVFLHRVVRWTHSPLRFTTTSTLLPSLYPKRHRRHRRRRRLATIPFPVPIVDISRNEPWAISIKNRPV